MPTMIRIRTKVGEGKVLTLYFGNEWVSIMSGIGKSQSTQAKTLLEAGMNHLAFCQKLKELSNVHRGRLHQELLHGVGHHGNDSLGIPSGNDRIDREGPNGRSGSEREEDVSPDSAPEENEDTFAF
jgi:hypothetical protein